MKTTQQKDIHTRINYRNALKKWAEIAEKSLVESAGKRKYKLRESVVHKHKLLKDVKEFTFRYYLYGMFVDMNVGRGRPLGHNNENKLVNSLVGKKRRRKSKKDYMWYTRPMYRHVRVLGNIVASEYSDIGYNATALPEVIELTFNP